MFRKTKVLVSAVVLGVFGWASLSYAAQKPKNEDCLTCHNDAVDEGRFKSSIHGTFNCVDCHTDVKKAEVHTTAPQKPTCQQCHADEQNTYSHSVHTRLTKSGNAAAACSDCHGNVHEVVTSSEATSPVSHKNIPATCGKCHGQSALMQSVGQTTQPFKSYQDSVHGKAVAQGNEKAAVCTDCHDSHGILPANDPKSQINRFNVPATCGRCHANEEQPFLASIHGEALARGNGQAPSCTDCHGIHTIQKANAPTSPVSERNMAQNTCARCHEGVRVSQEFGFASGRVASYFDSYHGLAAQGGSVTVANCASCHGTHNILPSSDPNSMINRANLAQTCGRCHQGATEKFAQTPIHLNPTAPPSDLGTKVVKWTRWIYIALIWIVLGAMLLHNIVLWRGKAIARRRMVTATVPRMTTNQRWQHLVLLTSFIVLVITGFALKFPYSWYAQLLGMSEHVRSIVHRVAGVVLLCAGAYHLVYLATLREGRRMIRDIFPLPKDAFDAVRTLGYHLGLVKERPQFGRFNYAEKAEYWALVWGTVLMGLTGIMLWAKVWVANKTTGWMVDVATVIHYYEAILATFAIVIWHFYQVIFDSDIYPMNWAWYDGKMPVEHYKHEHGLDTETLADVEGQRISDTDQPQH
ncbi:MAG: cytochrome b/b6 domain-containing protein [Acidobacteriaceae bacterium]|nr:cytochrome b/b6 domain-containing protein [Acidobacteriaceae bacterium]